MRQTLTAILAMVLVAMAAATAAAGAADEQRSENMSLVGNWNEPGYRMGTDLAFWKDVAVLGRFDGLRLLDVSDPEEPDLLGAMDCPGNQNDVSIWEDLVFVSVDSPMAHAGCDASPAPAAQVVAGNAWEGIRIVDVGDPTAPVRIGDVYVDCGSHTHTLVPDLQNRDRFTDQPDPRVLLYVSSYPLGGQGIRCNAETHRQITIVEVPLRDPSRARVIATPDVSPAVGCHDITVFLPRRLAVAACITESQVWDISDPARPVVLSRITDPTIQIHHSSALSWDGGIAVIGDEMGGAAAAAGCFAGGQAPTGALYFYDISDPLRPTLQSSYVVPQNETSTLCTAHNFNVVPLRSGRRVLVSAWYNGGTHVIDFTDASQPAQLGWAKPQDEVKAAAWSSYWYRGHIFTNNFDAGYVPSDPRSRGLDVFRITHPALEGAVDLARLNPQTQERLPHVPVVDGTALPPWSSRAAVTRSTADARPAVPARLPFCLLAAPA